MRSLSSYSIGQFGFVGVDLEFVVSEEGNSKWMDNDPDIAL